MPLPKLHLESIQQQLKVHEDRLSILRGMKELPPEAASGQAPKKKYRPEVLARRKELLTSETNVHQTLLELGRDPKVLEALGKLATDRQFATEAAKDPAGAAARLGIKLPVTLKLQLKLETQYVGLRIVFYDKLYPFGLSWNSVTGFSTRRVTRK